MRQDPFRSDRVEVVVGAGTLRSAAPAAVRFPHRWTDDGVAVEADFTGAHLLHPAAAGCVLNDTYREAATLGIPLAGVRVTAAGGVRQRDQGLDRHHLLRLARPPADPAEPAHLLAVVDEVAEIPRRPRRRPGGAGRGPALTRPG